MFSKPLTLTDGTEVVVHIEPLTTTSQADTSEMGEDFAALSFFGMWAEREDMKDSTAWVRRNRKQWQQRLARQD